MGFIRRLRTKRLMAMLTSDRLESRLTAARTLGTMKACEAVPALLRALRDPDPQLRAEAAHALGIMRDAAAIGPLTENLFSQYAVVRDAAAGALIQLGPQCASPVAAALLKSGPRDVRDEAMKVLATIGDDNAVQQLVAALKTRDRRRQTTAARALGQIRSTVAVDDLLTALAEADPDVRKEAVLALGEIADSRAADRLFGTLKDDRAEVRESAARALEKLRWQPSSPDAEGWFLAAKSDWHGLVQLREAGAEALAFALRSSSVDMRHKIAEALSYARGPWRVDLLLAAMKDPESSVACRAAEALGEVRDVRAAEGLVAALESPDPELRQQAGRSLGKMREPRTIPLLAAGLTGAHPHLRQSAGQALALMKLDESVNILMDALGHESPFVREAAVEALDRIEWGLSPEQRERYGSAKTSLGMQAARAPERPRISVPTTDSYDARLLVDEFAKGLATQDIVVDALQRPQRHAVRKELIRLVKSSRRYDRSVRQWACDMLNLTRGSEDEHLLCPECGFYMGTGDELRRKAADIRHDMRDEARARRTMIIGDRYRQCPKCHARVIVG